MRSKGSHVLLYWWWWRLIESNVSSARAQGSRTCPPRQTRKWFRCSRGRAGGWGPRQPGTRTTRWGWSPEGTECPSDSWGGLARGTRGRPLGSPLTSSPGPPGKAAGTCSESSCVSSGSSGGCRTCRSPGPCSSRACRWCGRGSVSSDRCCWQTSYHSHQIHIWKAFPLQESTGEVNRGFSESSELERIIFKQTGGCNFPFSWRPTPSQIPNSQVSECYREGILPG